MLKELIQEDAAGGAAGVTSAGAVAGFREPLGSKSKKKGKKKNKMQRRAHIGLPYSFHMVGESKGAGFGAFLSETEDADFDRSDVIAKLKTAAKAAEEKGEDSAGFVLEDEKGSMVKVWVPEEEADNFAQALQAALAGADENEDDQNDSVEIAEVLWKLRKQFDIINVEWGDIPEDEEEPVQPEGGAEMSMDAEGPEGGEMSLDAEAGGEEGGDMTADAGEVDELGAETGGGEEAAASALTQVIDMMKADAEARKAEAEARSAEAVTRTSAEKVKQEEEVLDMEAYYDDQKEADKETQQIAKLAKYKHDIAGERGAGLAGQSPEMPEPDVEVEKDVDVDVDVDPGMEPEMEEVRRRSHRNDTSITRGELQDMLLKALRR